MEGHDGERHPWDLPPPPTAPRRTNRATVVRSSHSSPQRSSLSSQQHEQQQQQQRQHGEGGRCSQFRQLLVELEREYERETGQLRNKVQRLSEALDGTPSPAAAASDILGPSNAASDILRPSGERSSLVQELCNKPDQHVQPTNSGGDFLASDNFRLWPEWTGDEVSTKKFRATEVMAKHTSKMAGTHTDASQEQESRKRGCCGRGCRPIHPSSTFQMMWQLLGVFVLSVDVVYIPLQVFLVESSIWTRIVDWATLLYWSMDIMMTFISGYYDRDGMIVMEFGRIAMRYIKGGWFEMDFVIVAVDIISNVLEIANLESAGTGDSLGLARLGKFLRIARVVRTLRLLRLVKLRQLLYAVQERIQSESIAILVGLAQNMVGLLVINHYVACCWFLIGKVSGPVSWVTENGMSDMGPAEQYLMSLHWSMTQFTPASMRVFPENGRERLFTVALLFVAIVVFSSFVSSITSAMTRLRGLTASLTSQKFLLRKFLKENRISKELSARITRYIDLAVEVHQRRTTQDKVSLLKLLSGPLTVSLQREVHAPFLTVHPIFAHYAISSKSAISQICFTAVAKNFYSKSDMVFDASVQAEFMYFLISGSLYYKRLKLPSAVRRTLPIVQGMWFTEPVLWMHWVHLGSVKATIESEIITIRSSAFRAVSLSYPAVGQYARAAALEYAEWFQSHVGDGLVWDIPVRWLDPDRHTQGNEVQRRDAVNEVTAAEGWEAQMMAEASESEEEEEVELPMNLIPSSTQKEKRPRDTAASNDAFGHENSDGFHAENSEERQQKSRDSDNDNPRDGGNDDENGARRRTQAL